MLVLSCSNDDGNNFTTFTDDRDGKVYRFVKIGVQTWMAENLNYPVKGSKCYGEDGDVYDINDDLITLSYSEIYANCNKYGRLYSWATAMAIDTKYNDQSWGGSDVNHRGICPSGWHIPSDVEWQILVDFAGGNAIAGKKLKATNGWHSNGNGTDDYGFAAMSGGMGCCFGHFLEFFEIDLVGSWWGSGEYDGDYNGDFAYSLDVYYSYDVAYGEGKDSKVNLRSLRCIKD